MPRKTQVLFQMSRKRKTQPSKSPGYVQEQTQETMMSTRALHQDQCQPPFERGPKKHNSTRRYSELQRCLLPQQCLEGPT